MIRGQSYARRRKYKASKRPGERIFEQFSHYLVLKVRDDATQQEIKVAWLKFAKEHHPDRNSGSEAAHKKFIRGKLAFATLMDPMTRSKHNEELRRREVELLMKLHGSTGIFARKSGPWPLAPGH